MTIQIDIGRLWFSMQVAPALSGNTEGPREEDSDLSVHVHNVRLARLKTLRMSRRPITVRQALIALNHWGSWTLVVVLVASQFTCLIWDSQTTEQYMIYGQDPRTGPYHIEGYNDEPYSDRNLVCVRQGRLFKPKQMSMVLASPSAEIVDTGGFAVSSYRVVTRHEINLREEIAQRYARTCSVLAATLDAIADSCNSLGYNVVDVGDNLRIVDGIFSNVTQRIRNSLPVIIMPFWDNAIYGRYAMPGTDGSACMFRLSGQFDSATADGAWLTSVNRRVREARTTGWLGIPQSHSARWKNGWLEDPTTGMRWYSDTIGSLLIQDDKYGIRPRQFDLKKNVEVNCSYEPDKCQPPSNVENWGDRFVSVDSPLWSNTIAISNGTRYGLFQYDALHRTVVRSKYDVATLISNTTVFALLLRWFAASIALLNAYRRGYNAQFTTVGVGCLSCARNFELLPLLLLPRLSPALAAFFTSGCRFEGEQRPISEAWFAIYPAIAEVLLYYYSLLNILAKLLRRRMSDVLFGPTLGLLCGLHMLRIELANSHVFEFDGRISTVMTADEYMRLRLLDFFTSDAALRLNGNIRSIFAIKLGALLANLLPLLLGEKTKPADRRGELTQIEVALGICATDSSGLGTIAYDDTLFRRRLPCVDLVRLGYVVFGDAVVVSLSDWLLTVLFSVLRTRATNIRVLAFHVRVDEVPGAKELAINVESPRPTLYCLHDAVIRDASVWNVAALPLA